VDTSTPTVCVATRFPRRAEPMALQTKRCPMKSRKLRQPSKCACSTRAASFASPARIRPRASYHCLIQFSHSKVSLQSERPLVLRVIHTIQQAITHHRSYQIPLHRRKPVPMAKVDPGLRRESGGVELNQLNGSMHQSVECGVRHFEDARKPI
jgi:hypothetical protein